MVDLGLSAIDSSSFVIGGVVVEGVRITIQTLYQMVLQDRYQSWKAARQSKEEWYNNVDQALVKLDRSISDYRCGLLFKDSNQIEKDLDEVAETLQMNLRDPPDEVDESLQEELLKLSGAADMLAGTPSGEEELQRGIEDFIGEITLSEYEDRMDEAAQETQEKLVEVRQTLRERFE